jgi:hypothetical protein
VPGPRNPGLIRSGLFWAGLGAVVLVAGKDPYLAWLFLGGGGLRIVAAWFFAPSEPTPAADGPDPLRATPTGRFRATGWPPSKNPEDYR